MNHDSKSSTWVDCPPNTIGKMLDADQALKRQVMRRTLLVGGGVTLTALAAGIIGIIQEKGSDDSQAQLTCREVNKYLKDFVANNIKDQQLVVKIKDHLGKCGWCEKQRQKLLG